MVRPAGIILRMMDQTLKIEVRRLWEVERLTIRQIAEWYKSTPAPLGRPRPARHERTVHHLRGEVVSEQEVRPEGPNENPRPHPANKKMERALD